MKRVGRLRSSTQVLRAGLLAIFLAASGPACRPSSESQDAALLAEKSEPATTLLFPKSVHVDDESVNAFIEKAMSGGSSRNYDDFRSLWSAAAEPMSRGEFEYGWQALRRISVVALEKALLESEDKDKPGDRPVVYAFLAEVNLDPDHRAAREEPNREVVLMVVRENDQWRLAHAPKKMRSWLRSKVEKTSSTQVVPATDGLPRKTP